jgi:hypothetical protein
MSYVQAVFVLKRFDRGNSNCEGLIVPKAKRKEGRTGESQPFRERTLSV